MAGCGFSLKRFMTQIQPLPSSPLVAPPRVHYRTEDIVTLLRAPGTLAVFEFGTPSATVHDPRVLSIGLPGLGNGPMPLEHWRIDADVDHGRDGPITYARGGGWLFAAVQVAEADHGDDVERTAEFAYRTLCTFLAGQPEQHVQRIWNYLDAINAGEGDGERYKHFCNGRLRGMGAMFDEGFPAATAIGQPLSCGSLTLYCLASAEPGTRIENPRQMSAWRYPRQYGRTPPSFARAMRLPGDDTLAISGTAAITGHESRHTDDLDAQLTELAANLDALLDTAGMPTGFDHDAPLKVYVRHRQDITAVEAFLNQRMPDAPRVLLQGDVCRRELLVEIDGWRYG